MVQFTSHFIIYFDFFCVGVVVVVVFLSISTSFYPASNQTTRFLLAKHYFISISYQQRCPFFPHTKCTCKYAWHIYVQPFCFRLHCECIVSSVESCKCSHHHICKIHANIHQDQTPFHINIVSVLSCSCLPRNIFPIFFPRIQIGINIILLHFVCFFLYQNQFRVCSSQFAANVIALLHIVFTVRAVYMYVCCVCVCV